MKSLGEKIKKARRTTRMTQKEFAESICISQSHLSMVEHNKEGLSKATKKLLWLQYSIEDFEIKD